MTITELSLQYGFNSNSSFTKTFKNFHGISPTEFRKSNVINIARMDKKGEFLKNIFAILITFKIGLK